MKMITVIIPVYNTARYLERCIGSVVNQTYKNLEIILVDDGSTDDSYEICKQWAKRDHRILLIHKENGGQSSARNLALDIATGDYIAFVDSDDWIEPDMYEVLYHTLVDSDKEVALCKLNQGQWPQGDMYTAILRDQEGSHLVKFLFARHLWNHIRMPLGRFAEDIAVLHEVLYQKDIEMVDRTFYHYFGKNPENSSNSPQNRLKNIVDRALMLIVRYQWTQDKQIDVDTKWIIQAKTVSFIIAAMGRYSEQKDKEFRGDISQLLDFSRMYYWDILKNKYVSFMRKVAISIIYISPRLYYRIRKLKV